MIIVVTLIYMSGNYLMLSLYYHKSTSGHCLMLPLNNIIKEYKWFTRVILPLSLPLPLSLLFNNLVSISTARSLGEGRRREGRGGEERRGERGGGEEEMGEEREGERRREREERGGGGRRCCTVSRQTWLPTMPQGTEHCVSPPPPPPSLLPHYSEQHTSLSPSLSPSSSLLYMVQS